MAAAVLALSAHAATITGEVTSDGNAVRGALVTLFTADGLVSETVYADGAGHYRLSGNINGASILRVRAPLYADEAAKLTVPAGDAKLTHSFAIRRLTNPQEISDSLPASAHFTRIKLPTTLDRQIFQLDCVGCHQIGNPLTRRQRSPEVWTAFMRIMTRNAEYPTDAHVATYASVMAHAFDGTPVPAVEQTAVDEKALTARVFEWKLPGAIVSHDSEFYPPDGTFYSVEQNIDQLYVTDPKTNKTTVIPIPPLNGRIRGTFADEKDLPSWVPAVRHGVHSLQLGPDGKFYMTGSIGGEILVFDPTKRTFKSYQIGHSAMYPHTPRFDSKGILWFTMYVSNQIGRFDPKTGHMTVIELPNVMVRNDGRITAPYGIDINPLDGSVWYTKLWANKIGRIDPVTFRVQEWVPPVIGPRRARFDDKGGFWIPGFGDGKITRLDTKTMTYKTYNIPTLAPNETEAPYALAVEPKTQNVWITVNMSDRMFRFEPTTEKWTAYPLPTRGLFTRDVVFASDGRVCGSSNPWGLPQKDIVEGDMDSLICVQPEGNQAAK
jgi:streptogramin lyase